MPKCLRYYLLYSLIFALTRHTRGAEIRGTVYSKALHLTSPPLLSIWIRLRFSAVVLKHGHYCIFYYAENVYITRTITRLYTLKSVSRLFYP